MTASAAIFSTAIVLLFAASLLIWNGPPIGAIARAFPRSRRAGIATMTVSAIWTLYHVAHLSEADFGNYRSLIFVALGGLAIGAIAMVPDFLAVRGTAALALLVSGLLLSATFMHYEASAILLNALVYLVILAALYLAVAPFRLRDFFQWLFGRPNRARMLGAAVGAYGLMLLTTGLTAS